MFWFTANRFDYLWPTVATFCLHCGTFVIFFALSWIYYWLIRCHNVWVNCDFQIDKTDKGSFYSMPSFCLIFAQNCRSSNAMSVQSQWPISSPPDSATHLSFSQGKANKCQCHLCLHWLRHPICFAIFQMQLPLLSLFRCTLQANAFYTWGLKMFIFVK